MAGSHLPAVMGRGRGLALCLAVLLCLSGCVLTQEKPLENPQAQAIVDAVQAIPEENPQASALLMEAVGRQPK